jgi:hypothetical protein
LGERCLNNWIGAIEVTPLPPGLNRLKRSPGREAEPPSAFRRLDHLKDTVDALIGSVCEQLPPRPHHEWAEGAEWTLWELEPEEADDYQHQRDLFVAVSANSRLWTAAHSGELFWSERFSRCGETFCYVKLDGSEGLGEAEFSDRSEIEDALNAVLKPRQLGCCLGGGTGRRYSYVDLAFTDVNKGIQAARQRLQEGRVQKRSWILFFDSDLAAEWVGIYDESPPPPMTFDSA